MKEPPGIARAQAFFGAFIAAVSVAGLQPPAQAQPSPRIALSSVVAARPAPQRKGLRHRKRELKLDSDHDGLSNWTELRRTRTNPHKADSDGDGLKDGVEVKRTKTNPRKADSDGDGFSDGEEIIAGSNPWDPASVPGLPWPAAGGLWPSQPEPRPPAPEEPASPPPAEPAKAIWQAPSGARVDVPVTLDGTASTGEAPLTCTWSFENQSGNTVFERRAGCKIDFTFEEAGEKYVRLTVQAADGTDSNRQSLEVAEAEPESPGEPETPDTTPPDTTIASGPTGTTTATSASFSFSSSEAGSTFECKLDAASFVSCTSPKSYSGLSIGSHTFEVRATDAAGNVDQSPASRAWTVEESEPLPSGGGCVAGATSATSASAVTNAVSSGKSVCVTTGIGDVRLEGLGDRSGVIISTEEGSMGHVLVKETAGLTIRSARLRSIEIRSADRTTLEDSVLGGTPANRVYDQLIFAPDESNDVTIRDNDLGWTLADNSGNTGYGCRCYGELNNLQFVGNKLHDLAGDGFQGSDGSNVLIDRNDIGPVGANPSSSEHTDNIQIVSNGPNMRITNNWIHEQGYFEGEVTHNSGSTYIHGQEGAETTGSLTYENNLIETNQGRTEVCGLGTGGTLRSDITIKNNTWIEGGLAYANFPGFEWDCDSGSGDTITRNIAIDPDGGLAQDGFASAFVEPNLWGRPGLVTLDAQGNCTSANCNPSSGPIGYRKPSGVNW